MAGRTRFGGKQVTVDGFFDAGYLILSFGREALSKGNRSEADEEKGEEKDFGFHGLERLGRVKRKRKRKSGKAECGVAEKGSAEAARTGRKGLGRGSLRCHRSRSKLNFFGNRELFQTAAVPLVAPLRGSIQLGKECSRTEQRRNVLIDAGRGRRVV